MRLSGVMKTNTLSAAWSVCASPTNSAVSPHGVNFERWSIIRDVNGLMHTTMLPAEPSSKNYNNNVIHVRISYSSASPQWKWWKATPKK